jgi:hypothetical protein
MLWFCLIKIAVELVSSWAALHVILLIVIAVVEVSEVVLSLLSPEWIFFFLFLPTDQVIHFRASPLSELHVSHCQVLHWYFFAFLFAFLLIVIWIWVLLVTDLLYLLRRCSFFLLLEELLLIWIPLFLFDGSGAGPPGFCFRHWLLTHIYLY